MTTPTGRPAWTRTGSFTDYGGSANKANFQNQTIVNPRTDVGAEGFSRLVSDVAAVVRTAAFASMRIVCNDTTPGDPTVEYCQMMTGATVIPYAGRTAPGVAADGSPVTFPTCKRNGVGDVTITFASSYNDEYGIAGAFIAVAPSATIVGTGACAMPEIISATQIRVRLFNLDNTPVANGRFSFSVGSGPS